MIIAIYSLCFADGNGNAKGKVQDDEKRRTGKVDTRFAKVRDIVSWHPVVSQRYSGDIQSRYSSVRTVMTNRSVTLSIWHFYKYCDEVTQCVLHLTLMSMTWQFMSSVGNEIKSSFITLAATYKAWKIVQHINEQKILNGAETSSNHVATPSKSVQCAGISFIHQMTSHWRLIRVMNSASILRQILVSLRPRCTTLCVCVCIHCVLFHLWICQMHNVFWFCRRYFQVWTVQR